MYQIVYTKTAVKQIPNLKAAKLDGRVKKLISILEKDPFQNPPPYEKLIGDLKTAYSRRINVQHRLVYQVYEKEQTVKNIKHVDALRILKRAPVLVELVLLLYPFLERRGTMANKTIKGITIALGADFSAGRKSGGRD